MKHRPRGRRGRSADRHCRRRRRQPLQLDGQPLDRRLPEDHRRARRRPAQQHRRRGARQDRLRAPDQFLRRRRHQGRAAVPDDARDHPHEGLRGGARKHGEAALLDRPHRADAGSSTSSSTTRPATGDLGEVDARGPWNEGGDWEFVQSPAAPAQNGANGNGSGGEQSHETAEAALESSIPSEPDAIQESLVEHLRDLLHAERQLVKALPKMAKAAHAAAIEGCLRHAPR